MKKIYKQIEQYIKESNHILLSLHNGPDGDSVGSNLAMYEYLVSIGKEVDLIKGESVLPNYLSGLPLFDKIVPKSIDELDISQYDLFLALDSSTLKQISNDHFSPPKNLKIIVIDHHKSNDNYGIINCVDTKKVSASEIIAGIFQDYHRATIAGARTLGKGSYDAFLELSDGSAIYLTMGRWLTPNDREIEGVGITPDEILTQTGDDAIQWAVDYLHNH